MEWRTVAEYPNYKVSDQGDMAGKFGAMSPTPLRGYRRTYIPNANGVRKAVYLHRLVAQAFIPNPDKLDHVNHINGITLDNRVENLEWCTTQYNSEHAVVALGRGGAPITISDDDVREIRKRAAGGEYGSVIARSMNLRIGTVQEIISGRKRRHVLP